MGSVSSVVSQLWCLSTLVPRCEGSPCAHFGKWWFCRTMTILVGDFVLYPHYIVVGNGIAIFGEVTNFWFHQFA